MVACPSLLIFLRQPGSLLFCRMLLAGELWLDRGWHCRQHQLTLWLLLLLVCLGAGMCGVFLNLGRSYVAPPR